MPQVEIDIMPLAEETVMTPMIAITIDTDLDLARAGGVVRKGKGTNHRKTLQFAFEPMTVPMMSLKDIEEMVLEIGLIEIDPIFLGNLEMLLTLVSS